MEKLIPKCNMCGEDWSEGHNCREFNLSEKRVCVNGRTKNFHYKEPDVKEFIRRLKDIDLLTIIKRELDKDFKIYRGMEWSCMQTFGTDHAEHHEKLLRLKIEHIRNRIIDKLAGSKLT